MKATHHFDFPDVFRLEAGGHLPGFRLQYTTAGTLNADKSNVVWVCHALTGNSDASDWWKGLFEAGGAFDTRDHFIVCANTIGSCYGSTGPLSVNPETGSPWYHAFPAVTNRDVVRAFDELRRSLGLTRIHTLIGGSLGGQQVLEWAILCPDVFEHIIPVACNAWHSPWGIAFNETQRMAIELDPTWKENDAAAGQNGIQVARAIAMISYRSHDIYDRNQPESSSEKLDGYRASSYQRYQGLKLSQRFNAYSYHLLSRMMDSHHVGRGLSDADGRKSAENALSGIRAKTLVVGIDQDILFPVQEQLFLSAHISGARYAEISSAYGHDSFLVEFEQLNQIIRYFFLKPDNGKNGPAASHA